MTTAVATYSSVRETTRSTGTGAIVLQGPELGCQALGVVGDGATCDFRIRARAGGKWEEVTGVFTAATQSLTRDTVLGSSNGGDLVDFAEGIKDVTLLFIPQTSTLVAHAASIAALEVKQKYLLAGYDRVHMLADTDLAATAALAGDALQAAANTRANLLKASAIAHAAEEGSVTVDGAHLAADAGNSATLTAVADASDLATCITLVDALLVFVTAHGNQAGVHFHADATAAALTMTHTPPTTLAHCITDLNELLAGLQAHYALASA